MTALASLVIEPDNGHAVPSDTYRTFAAAKADQGALRKLQARLRLPEEWLKLDANGCWQIEGPRGRIYTHADKKGPLGGFLVICHSGDEKLWRRTRTSLGGTVRQNGDTEGVVLLRPEEVNVPAVRQAIGCAR